MIKLRKKVAQLKLSIIFTSSNNNKMKIAKKIIDRLGSDLNFKNGLQSAMGLPESTLRYRIKNNTRLDEKEALDYFRANGYDDKKLFQ